MATTHLFRAFDLLTTRTGDDPDDEGSRLGDDPRLVGLGGLGSTSSLDPGQERSRVDLSGGGDVLRGDLSTSLDGGNDDDGEVLLALDRSDRRLERGRDGGFKGGDASVRRHLVSRKRFFSCACYVFLCAW
jgi:hypothetical protein